MINLNKAVLVNTDGSMVTIDKVEIAWIEQGLNFLLNDTLPYTADELQVLIAFGYLKNAEVK